MNFQQVLRWESAPRESFEEKKELTLTERRARQKRGKRNLKKIFRYTYDCREIRTQQMFESARR